MTEKPRDTSLRDAFVGILMTVGPFFGVRYRPPRVETPVVTTPANDRDGGTPIVGNTSEKPAMRGDEPPDDDGAVI